MLNMYVHCNPLVEYVRIFLKNIYLFKMAYSWKASYLFIVYLATMFSGFDVKLK